VPKNVGSVEHDSHLSLAQRRRAREEDLLAVLELLSPRQRREALFSPSKALSQAGISHRGTITARTTREALKRRLHLADRTKMAIRIQKVMRGHRARKQFRAAIKLQSVFRGHKSRNALFNSIPEHVALEAFDSVPRNEKANYFKSRLVYSLVKDLSFFRTLSPRVGIEICSVGVRKQLKQGREIRKSEDEANAITVLVSGQLEVFKDKHRAPGTEQFLGPGAAIQFRRGLRVPENVELVAVATSVSPQSALVMTIENFEPFQSRTDVDYKAVQERVVLLRQVPMWANAKPSLLLRLAYLLSPRRVSPHHVLVAMGEICDSVHIVASGQCRVLLPKASTSALVDASAVGDGSPTTARAKGHNAPTGVQATDMYARSSKDVQMKLLARTTGRHSGQMSAEVVAVLPGQMVGDVEFATQSPAPATVTAGHGGATVLTLRWSHLERFLRSGSKQQLLATAAILREWRAHRHNVIRASQGRLRASYMQALPDEHVAVTAADETSDGVDWTEVVDQGGPEAYGFHLQPVPGAVQVQWSSKESPPASSHYANVTEPWVKILSPRESPTAAADRLFPWGSPRPSYPARHLEEDQRSPSGGVIRARGVASASTRLHIQRSPRHFAMLLAASLGATEVGSPTRRPEDGNLTPPPGADPVTAMWKVPSRLDQSSPVITPRQKAMRARRAFVSSPASSSRSPSRGPPSREDPRSRSPAARRAPRLGSEGSQLHLLVEQSPAHCGPLDKQPLGLGVGIYDDTLDDIEIDVDDSVGSQRPTRSSATTTPSYATPSPPGTPTARSAHPRPAPAPDHSAHSAHSAHSTGESPPPSPSISTSAYRDTASPGSSASRPPTSMTSVAARQSPASHVRFSDTVEELSEFRPRSAMASPRPHSILRRPSPSASPASFGALSPARPTPRPPSGSGPVAGPSPRLTGFSTPDGSTPVSFATSLHPVHTSSWQPHQPLKPPVAPASHPRPRPASASAARASTTANKVGTPEWVKAQLEAAAALSEKSQGGNRQRPVSAGTRRQ